MKVLKYIGIALLSLVLLTVLLLILLANPPGERWAKGWLERKLTAEVGLPVTIAEFETNLFSRIQARQLMMLSDTAMSADTFVFISHLRLGYSIPDLLGSEVYLKALVVDSVAIAMAFDSMGHTGIALLDSSAEQPPAEAGQPIFVRVDTMALGSFRAGLVDRRLPVTLQLFGASVELQGAGSRDYSGAVAVDSLCGVYDSIPLCVRDLKIAAGLAGDTVRISSASANVADLQWKAEGTLSGPEFDEMAITTSLEGDPSQLMNIARTRLDQPDIGLQYLALTATVRGTMTAPMAQVRLDARQLSYDQISIPSLSLSTHYVSDSLLVDSFMVRAFGGDLSGSGHVLTDTTFASDFRIKVTGLKIAPVWQAIYGETSPYRGNLTADISIGGSGDRIAGWTASSEAHASDLRYGGQAIPDLDIQATLVDELADLSFKHGRNVIGASLKVQAETLSGNFRLDLPDISSLAALVNQPDLTGAILASGSIAGSVENPSVQATAEGSRLSYQNFPIDSLHAKVGYSDSMLTITEFFCLGRFDEIPAGREVFEIDSLNAAVDYR